MIERAVILARNRDMSFSLAGEREPDVWPGADDDEIIPAGRWRDWERRNIALALQKSRGKISGAGGAAELLQVKPSTLMSRIKSLGLARRETLAAIPKANGRHAGGQ